VVPFLQQRVVGCHDTKDSCNTHNERLNDFSENAMPKQRISYFPLEMMDDAMRAEMQRCAVEGTPRPESQAVRAHVPGAFWSFANTWRDIFHTGICDHAVKEICRLYVSRSVKCEFCGNQRSIKAFSDKLEEAQTDDLINFEKSTQFDDRQKAALAYAEAITWRLDTDDAFWDRLHRHFSEPELVELGNFIATTMGQQSWLRLLNIEHHQVMAGEAGSMAPGFETPEALAKAKAAGDYWANQTSRPHKTAA
jgi:alkylhydroperoxidase family enzyme